MIISVLFSLWLAGVPFLALDARTGDQEARPGPESIDGLMATLYEAISFPEGGSPDWDRYRDLFSSAAVPCVRIAADGVRVMDRESFIEFFKDRIASREVKSFIEREISRTTKSYGGLAQVFSTYAKRLNLNEPGTETRGINAIQLYFKDGRWWIASFVWQDEQPGLPIPEEFLKENPHF